MIFDDKYFPSRDGNIEVLLCIPCGDQKKHNNTYMMLAHRLDMRCIHMKAYIVNKLLEEREHTVSFSLERMTKPDMVVIEAKSLGVCNPFFAAAAFFAQSDKRL